MIGRDNRNLEEESWEIVKKHEGPYRSILLLLDQSHYDPFWSHDEPAVICSFRMCQQCIKGKPSCVQFHIELSQYSTSDKYIYVSMHAEKRLRYNQEEKHKEEI